MTNPLLDSWTLPPFSAIKPEQVEPAVDAVLAECRDTVNALLAQPGPFSWDNLMAPLEEVEDKLSRIWSPVQHMNSVVNEGSLREAYNRCLPKLSAYSSEMGQLQPLFAAIDSIAQSPAFAQLSKAQQQVINNALRDFRLSGVDLPPEQQAQYRQLKQELSTLATKFEENILDVTHAWQHVVTDAAELAGLPEYAVEAAREAAKAKSLDGFLFNLEFPSYYPVLTYADSASLRETLYRAYVTRASDAGPHEAKFDNSTVMEAILTKRQQLARLLGFKHYADYSLATKMASSTEQVLSFLNDLAKRSKPQAEKEWEALRAFAKVKYGVDALNPWDMSYYSEKQRAHLYAFSQEDLRPYFSEDNVLKGMFQVIKKLYGMRVEELKGVDVWHEHVRFFSIYDETNTLRGQFYLDLYARAHKRGGAWMDECRVRRRQQSGGVETPVAYLTCNFTPPTGDRPALFSHDEVETLFHEFGHGLHHMLTQVETASVSGINGVAWDAVELPSQLMENWCWEREALDEFATHYETGESLPDALYKKMIAAKNFHSAMQMLRQLEFSLFDFRLHAEFDVDKPDFIQRLLDEVRRLVAVLPAPAFNRFQHSFSHIFAGGYAAGYYSYKWAEVLSSDVFAVFEERGVFDAETGRDFLNKLLSQGGSDDALALFVDFRGREPEIDALLRHSGIG